MPNLRRFFILSIFFSLFIVGCSKKEGEAKCDPTKFNCTPKITEVAVSEPIASEIVTVQEEVIETANIKSENEVNISRPDALNIIKPHLESLIKDEINTILGKNYQGWNIIINSITPESGNEGSRWIVKYDVSTGEKGILSDECTAKAQLSSEDESPMVYTLDTDCYAKLGNYI